MCIIILHMTLWALSDLWSKFILNKYSRQLIFLNNLFSNKKGSKLHNIGFRGGGFDLAGAVPNTLFIPSVIAEQNILDLAFQKVHDIIPVFQIVKKT